MAKKKSKGFIVPSINFITMQRPEAFKGGPDPAPAIEKKSDLKSASDSVPQTTPESVKDPVPESDPGTNPETRPETISESNPKSNPKSTSKSEQPAAPLPLKNAVKGRRKSALSLSSLKRKKQEEEEALRKRAAQNKTGNLPEEPFTEETFNKVWSSYIDSLHQNGEKILASILMADKPVIREHMIHVAYPNKLMKKELLKVRPRVLKHIRRELNNHSVDFVVEVKEENTKRFAYTPQEKYELLKEKNKDISLLRKTFNLEL